MNIALNYIRAYKQSISNIELNTNNKLPINIYPNFGNVNQSGFSI